MVDGARGEQCEPSVQSETNYLRSRLTSAMTTSSSTSRTRPTREHPSWAPPATLLVCVKDLSAAGIPASAQARDARPRSRAVCCNQ
eukprot:5454743-Prymnesium_polylepis.1